MNTNSFKFTAPENFPSIPPNFRALQKKYEVDDEIFIKEIFDTIFSKEFHLEIDKRIKQLRKTNPDMERTILTQSILDIKNEVLFEVVKNNLASAKESLGIAEEEEKKEVKKL